MTIMAIDKDGLGSLFDARGEHTNDSILPWVASEAFVSQLQVRPEVAVDMASRASRRNVLDRG